MAESADSTARDARYAARWDADVGVEHIADVYAKALLGAAQSAGQTQTALDDLDSLVGEVFEQFPRLETVLGSALVAHEDKLGILDRVLRGRVAPVLLDFLKVVSRHGRLDCLRAIRRQAHVLYDVMQGRVRVRLVTANPVDASLAAQINDQLRALLGGEPVLEQVVDPEVIGGAVLRIGDTVYDGSIANQLKTIRQQMIDRSVHEIQSRRDRFCNPARD
jgi:F-type H+-transporting ATPase subunit delta